MHIVGRDALDALERFVQAELAVEVDFLPGEVLCIDTPPECLKMLPDLRTDPFEIESRQGQIGGAKVVVSDAAALE